MLREVADGVLVRQSSFCQSNAVAVVGVDDGVLLVDPGVHGHELLALADEVHDLGLTVVAGFSTHPHWDHLLWHAALGSAPRYGTSRCVSTARARRDDASAKADRQAEDVQLTLLGLLTELPPGVAQVPWDGVEVQVLEHQAHAPGHAALLISKRGVLIAGDMLSDVEIPLLDLNGASDPIGDYLAALQLFDSITGDVGVVIPGHGSVGTGPDVLARRVDQDRAYLTALRHNHDPADARVQPTATYGCDWLPDEHRRQVRFAAQATQ